MRALVQDTYGSVDVLELRDVDRPVPGDGEVLVRVHAAGVDRGVWHLVTGLPYPTRLAFGLRRPRVPVPGLDLAGVVEAVGPEVTRFAVGDEVFGIGRGTFAEYAVAAEGKLARRPGRLTATEAAVLAVTGSTALQAVDDHGRVTRGDHVLVLGASGGVGTYAVQVAKARGATVTGVASTAKLDLVRDLGADHVVDYTRTDPGDGSARYDVVLDCGGATPLRRLRRAVTPTGTLVIVGGEGGGRWIGGLDRQVRAKLLSPVLRQRLTTFVAREDAEHLEALAGLVDRGELTPVVDRTYPLADAPLALADLAAGRARGKLVVAVHEAPRPVHPLG